MPNAPKALILLSAFAAIAACSDSSDQTNDPSINMASVGNDAMPTSNTPTDVDTLPQDESSATPSNELVNGEDSADLNGEDASPEGNADPE